MNEYFESSDYFFNFSKKESKKYPEKKILFETIGKIIKIISEDPNIKEDEAFDILCNLIQSKIKENGGKILKENALETINEIHSEVFQKQINAINTIRMNIANLIEDFFTEKKNLVPDSSHCSIDEKIIKELKYFHLNKFIEFEVSNNGQSITFFHEKFTAPMKKKLKEIMKLKMGIGIENISFVSQKEKTGQTLKSLEDFKPISNEKVVSKIPIFNDGTPNNNKNNFLTFSKKS